MDINIKNGDSLELLKDIKSDSVDCMVTDPPYGISFMDHDWDKAVPDIKIWKETYRVLKPGAFAFIMSSPRSDVQAEMVLKLKEAGYNIGFTPIYWTYLNGFPKSLNISKSINRKFGYKRKITGYDQNFGRSDSGIYQMNVNGIDKKIFEKHDEPESEEAKKLNGSYAGYSPKPAVEVIIVAMKPLSEKSYTDQALKNEKGITWLDDGRIPYLNDKDKEIAKSFGESVSGKPFNNQVYNYHKGDVRSNYEINNKGRFPANLLVSDNAIDTGKITKSTPSIQKPDEKGGTGNSLTFKHPNGSIIPYDDSGDISRYFSLDMWYEKNIEELPDYVQKIFPFLYVPKPSPRERNEDIKGDINKKWENGVGKDEYIYRETTMAKNIHPTVKSVKLMCYLIIIGSRKGDTILDPFLGSGTTGVASKMLDRNFIGFEIEKKYFEIAEQRIMNKSVFESLNDFEI